MEKLERDKIINTILDIEIKLSARRALESILNLGECIPNEMWGIVHFHSSKDESFIAINIARLSTPGGQKGRNIEAIVEDLENKYRPLLNEYMKLNEMIKSFTVEHPVSFELIDEFFKIALTEEKLDSSHSNYQDVLKWFTSNLNIERNSAGSTFIKSYSQQVANNLKQLENKLARKEERLNLLEARLKLDDIEISSNRASNNQNNSVVESANDNPGGFRGLVSSLSRIMRSCTSPRSELSDVSDVKQASFNSNLRQ